MNSPHTRLRVLARSATRLLSDALSSLLLRPGHTVGMVAGMLLGVASAVSAIVIADTQQAQIDLRFDLQRSSYAEVRAEGGTPPSGFPADQLEKIQRLEPVTAAGEFTVWQELVSITGSSGLSRSDGPLLVADSGGLAATGTTLGTSAPTSLLDQEASTRLAWIGNKVAKQLGVGPTLGTPDIDSQILIGGQPFSVAGILKPNPDFGYIADSVVISRPAATSIMGGSGSNVRVIAKVRPGAAQAVVAYSKKALNVSGNLSLTDITPPDGKLLLDNVAGDLRAIGLALGGFVGVVGLVTVTNTLMMSVHQRQRELGLRSAMGWSRRRIAALVLAESALAGLVAGVLGCALGLVAAGTWCWLHGWTLVIAPPLSVFVIVASVLASVIGGLVPALRASSISPLTAMRA